MDNRLALVLLVVFFCGPSIINAGVVKRQTYYYPNELRKYARPHAGTKFYQGTVGRYAPSEWPAWYTRTLFKWNGESRLGPYSPSDLKYLQYQQSRIQSEQNFAS